MNLRILCVEESAISGFGLRRLISTSGYQCCDVLGSFEEMLSWLQSNTCDLIVSEMRLRDIDLFDHFDKLRSLPQSPKVIVYSYCDNPTYAARASAWDAWDFILKSYPTCKLLESIDSFSKGVRPVHSLLTIARNYLVGRHHELPEVFRSFTKREIQIIVHLSLGLSNREVALSLNISLETVKEHVQNVLRKIEVTDRTAAAVWAIRKGFPTLSLESHLPSNNLQGPHFNRQEVSASIFH